MPAPFLRLAASILTAAAVSACAQLPPDYSPDYVQVPVMSRTHPDRVSRYELVPKACLTPDPTDTGLGGGRLPPGCANNANLLAMTEHKRDVIKGRKLGRAPASPSARAAQKYIYGSRGSTGGDVRSPVQPVTQAGTSSESAAPAAR